MGGLQHGIVELGKVSRLMGSRHDFVAQFQYSMSRRGEALKKVEQHVPSGCSVGIRNTGWVVQEPARPSVPLDTLEPRAVG